MATNLVPLYCRSEGQGDQTVVLIHGFCEDHRVWDGFVGPLAQAHRVLAVDLPGFGQSPLLDRPLQMAHLAEALQATLVAHGVERPLLVGHSLGGYVALAYARLYPGELAGLGLFHSSALPDSDERRQARDRVAADVRANGPQGFVRTLIPGLFAPEARAQHRPTIDWLVAEGSRLAPEAVAQTAEAMRDRPDSREVLQALAVPVLWVVGQADPVIPLEASLAQVALARDSTVHLLGGVGHMGMYEAPERTLRAVTDFCAAVGRAG
jgi:pimeloyl-ACP methyl ester carboxylesterase